jgi:hypothetical protein
MNVESQNQAAHVHFVRFLLVFRPFFSIQPESLCEDFWPPTEEIGMRLSPSRGGLGKGPDTVGEFAEGRQAAIMKGFTPRHCRP